MLVDFTSDVQKPYNLIYLKFYSLKLRGVAKAVNHAFSISAQKMDKIGASFWSN